ncbi:hypothetical protein [Streptacidiphilus carbonis]|jgi:hypothetical protein|uniref:hypothetical protein n=1 Tax=Streptacidiphilus carbonis TaxID=105422 RepID=UPI0005AB3035|nr:hypothetical protein [Streptacidiphilus carbonis]
MDDEPGLREQVIALRRAGMSRRQIRDELKIWNNDKLNRLLRGEPPPEWTRRPNAKDDLRAKAREMRVGGSTYDEIEEALGVARSSVSLWVRDLPRPPRRKPAGDRQEYMERVYWGPRRELRDRERQDAKSVASGEIGRLTSRELFLIGVGIYWSEGAKDKEYSRRECVTLVNSDPSLIGVCLAWLDLLAVDRSKLRFRVQIHESADVEAAERFWAQLVGVTVDRLQRSSLKKHNPKTVRHNTGADYRGCLVIKVLGGADLYRRIEGWWSGLVVEVGRLNPYSREASGPVR